MSRSQIAFAACTLLLLSGCRIYGGYDATEKNLEAMAVAIQEFEQDFTLMQRDVKLLQATDPANPGLLRFLDRLNTIALAHATVLQEHKEIYESLLGGGWSTTYRKVERHFQGMLAEHQMIRSRYRQLLPGQDFQGDPRATMTWNELDKGRYFVAPPYFQQVIQRDRMVSIAGAIADDRLLFEPDSVVMVDESVLGIQADSLVGPISPDTAATAAP